MKCGHSRDRIKSHVKWGSQSLLYRVRIYAQKKSVSNIMPNFIKIQSYLSAESGRKATSENRDLTYVQRREGNGQSALYMRQIV